MSGLLNRFFGKKQTKNKFKLKMIALKTRIILQKQMDMLFKNISQDDQKFKLVGTDPNQLYVLLKNIGEKVIEAESIKLYIEMMRKIEASSARIVQTNGDMAQLKAELYWFQSVLWFRKSKEITYLEELHSFGLNFFKGIDITEEININCEIFQLYPVTKYLKKKDEILPIKEILFYLQPYVSCNISQPTLDAVFIINNQDVNRKSLQRSGFNHSTINFPSKVPQNSIIPPNNSVLNNNNSGNFNIQQPTNHSYINMNVQTGNNNGNSMNIQANNQFSQFNINSSNLPLNQPNQSNINSNYNYNVTTQNYFNQNPTQPPNSNFNLPPPIIQPNNPQTSQLVDHKGNIAYTHSTTNPGYPNNNNYNNINNNNNHNNNNNFYNNPANYPTNNTTSFSDHNPFNSNPFNNNNNNNQIPPNYVQNYNSNNINSNVNNNNYNPVPYQQPEAIITPPNPTLNNTKKSAFSSLMKNVNTNIISNMNQLPKISPQTLPIPPTPPQVIQQKPIPHVQPVIEPIQVIQSKRQQIDEIIPAVVKHQKQQRYIPTVPIVPQQQEYFDVVEHQYQTNNDPKYQQIQLQTIKPVNKNKTEQQPKLIIDQVHPITPISNDNNTLNIQTTLDERQRQNNDFQYRESHGNNMSINRQSQDTLANGKNWKNKIKQWQQKEKRRKAQEQIKRKIQEQESQRNRLILEQKRQVEAQLRRIRQEQETRVRVIEENERRVKEQEQSRLRQIEDRKRRAMEQQERIEREEQERQRQRKARIQERQKQMSERQNERQFRFDVDDEREEIDRGLSGRFSTNMGFKANYDDQYGEQFSYEHSSDVKSSMLKFKGDEEERQVQKRQQQPINQPQNTKVSSNQVQIPQQSYEKTDEQQSLSIIRNNNNSQTQNPTPYKLFFYKRKETQ